MLRTLSSTFKVSLAMMFAVLSSGLMPVYASAYDAPSPTTPVQKVTICHSAGQSGTYTTPEIDTSAIDELNEPGANGHGNHENDIIPPFTSSPDGVVYEGKNWTTENQAIYSNDCVVPTTPPVNLCEANYFPDYEMWEITWGMQHTDTNGVPTFTMDSYGGLTSLNNGPVPDYMTSAAKWNWLYVTKANVSDGRTVTYGFADGTVITAVVSGDSNGCPVVEWTTTAPQPPVTLVPCESFPVITSTNLDTNGWEASDDSKVEYVDGGVKLSVDGNWDSTYITLPMSGELRDLGTGIDFAQNEAYLGLHVETSAGTLVYEKEASYAGKWWSKSDQFVAPDGMGYPTFDTLENIVANNPDVELVSVSILYTNPDVAEVTVTSAKFGCNEYTFDYERATEECTLESQEFSEAWGEDNPYAGGWVNGAPGGTPAEYEFADEGLHLSTPADESYVMGSFSANNTHIADVDAMSYETFRKVESAGFAGTLPAYILYVDIDGDGDFDKNFFYEPYYNGDVKEGESQTWDAYDNGDAIWWVSGTGQKKVTWNDLVATYQDARILEFGFNQGTSNEETFAIIQNLTFDCATMSFAAPEDDTDEEPEVPETPVVPETPTTPATPGNVLGDSELKDNTPQVLGTQTPAVLPATGNDTAFHLIGAVLAVLTYAVMYRRESVEQI